MAVNRNIHLIVGNFCSQTFMGGKDLKGSDHSQSEIAIRASPCRDWTTATPLMNGVFSG
jgi:hypothetical protein